MTVLDLITRSMRLLGAVSLGEVPEPAEEMAGLAALNTLVDSWAAQHLMIPTTARNIYNLTVGQAVYQIGPDAPDWQAPRPVGVESAGLLIPGSGAQQLLERPLRLIPNEKEWARVRLKGLQSTLPTALYWDGWFSNANPADQSVTNVGSTNIVLWPVPIQTGLQVALYTPSVIERFAGLTQLISLPPAYERALVYCLAVDLAPEFEREPSSVVASVAEAALYTIRAYNLGRNVSAVRIDPACRGPRGGRGGFDVYLGEDH